MSRICADGTPAAATATPTDATRSGAPLMYVSSWAGWTAAGRQSMTSSQLCA
jgi:hypothetical protein